MTNGQQRRDLRPARKNPFILIIVDSPLKPRTMMLGVSLPNHVVFSLKTSTGPISKTKSAGGETVILCHQALTTSSVAATATVPALALSVTNVPAVGMNQPFF